MKNQITGGKLPSKRDCLSVLLYNMRVDNLSLHESASLFIDECLIFWRKLRIPTQYRSNCIIKYKKLYENLRNLEKHRTRTSELYKNREITFNEDLNDLFDIASANALNLIKNNEDAAFLIAQRKKGRPGCMLGIDMKQTIAEINKIIRNEKAAQNRERQLSEMLNSGNLYLFIPSYGNTISIFFK